MDLTFGGFLLRLNLVAMTTLLTFGVVLVELDDVSLPFFHFLLHRRHQQLQQRTVKQKIGETLRTVFKVLRLDLRCTQTRTIVQTLVHVFTDRKKTCEITHTFPSQNDFRHNDLFSYQQLSNALFFNRLK